MKVFVLSLRFCSAHGVHRGREHGLENHLPGIGCGPLVPCPPPPSPCCPQSVGPGWGDGGGQPKPHSGRPRVGPARAESAPGDDLVPQRTTPSKTLCSLPAGKGRDGSQAGGTWTRGWQRAGLLAEDKGGSWWQKERLQKRQKPEAFLAAISCCLKRSRCGICPWPLTPSPEAGSPARPGGSTTDPASARGKDWFSWKPQTWVRDLEVPICKPCLSFRHHWSSYPRQIQNKDQPSRSCIWPVP